MNRNTVTATDPVFFVSSLLGSNIDREIIRYEDTMLEKKYPDFRYLMNEFHDGILLFDISSKKVWNKVQEDSTGLKEYYDLHKNNFNSKKGIEARIYTLKSATGMKELESAYRKYSGKPVLIRSWVINSTR
jgi:peptidyl-prolyl cis-trans isomerase SurA